VAEERLDQRGADRGGEDERARRRVRVTALLDEERQQCGDGCLAEVDAEVGAAEQTEAAAIEAARQRATTPLSARPSTAARVRCGDQPCSTRRWR
jgi:hypothetical protein